MAWVGGQNARVIHGSTMPKTKKSNCDLCLEKGHDVLKCEGACGTTVHRQCAGITKSHFDELNKSSAPYVCQLCVLKTTNAVIQQLQAEVAALKVTNNVVQQLQAEVAALKTDLAEAKSLLSAKQTEAAASQNGGPAWDRSCKTWRNAKARREADLAEDSTDRRQRQLWTYLSPICVERR